MLSWGVACFVASLNDADWLLVADRCARARIAAPRSITVQNDTCGLAPRCSKLQHAHNGGEQVSKGGLTITHAKEALSCAFMTALAAKARVLLNIGETFDYGIDGYLREVQRFHNGRHMANGLALDFQLKATASWENDPGDEHIAYDLEVKAYNDIAIRPPEEAGMVLILLCLPKQEAEWVQASTDALKLKHCCYWYRITGGCIAKNEEQRETIYIPKRNILDEIALTTLLSEERSRRLGLLR